MIIYGSKKELSIQTITSYMLLVYLLPNKTKLKILCYLIPLFF